MPSPDRNINKRLAMPWRAEAECLKRVHEEPILGGAFLYEKHALADFAQKICLEDCPVRALCLKDALLDKASEGWRAGVFFDKGCLSEEDSKNLQNEFPEIPTRFFKKRYRSEEEEDFEE